METLIGLLDDSNRGVAHDYVRHIDKNVPAEMDLHLVLDNYGSRKHPKVKTWLLNHPRYHLHFTPTYSSWLNQVERWFGLITQRAIRRGSFGSVKELVEKISLLCERISGTEH